MSSISDRDESKALSASVSSKNSRVALLGTPMRMTGGRALGAAMAIWREKGSSASYPAMTSKAAHASSTEPANTEMQSNVRQAGTTPLVDNEPTVGFRPTMLFRAA